MAFNFKETAVKATTLSELMANRDKASTDYMIENYPNGFTVVAFDIVAGADGATYPVFNIGEDASIFYCGGAILNKIAHEWSDAFNGDIEAANEELYNGGGLALKLEEAKTKRGNSLTRVVIL